MENQIQQKLPSDQELEELFSKELDPKKFQSAIQVTKIGKGAFGTVFSAYLTEKKKIAMKVVSRNSETDKHVFTKDDMIEIEILKQIKNPYLNGMIDYYFQKTTVQGIETQELVILQPLAKQDLGKFVEENFTIESEKMPEDLLLEFFAQILFGLKFLHDEKIVHRDISPNNILVFEESSQAFYNKKSYTSKLADFGCAKSLSKYSKQMDTVKGKDRYMAPEVGKGEYTYSVDIYSLGMTIFDIITGKNLNTVEIQSKSVNTDGYSQDLIQLLYKMCSSAPEERPTVDQLIGNALIKRTNTYRKEKLNQFLEMPLSVIDSPIDKLINQVNQILKFKKTTVEDLKNNLPQQRFIDIQGKRLLHNNMNDIAQQLCEFREVYDRMSLYDVKTSRQHEFEMGKLNPLDITKFMTKKEQKSYFYYWNEEQKCQLLKSEAEQLKQISRKIINEEIVQGLFNNDGKMIYGRIISPMSITVGAISETGKPQGEYYAYGINENGDLYYEEGDQKENIKLVSNGEFRIYNPASDMITVFYKNGDVYHGLQYTGQGKIKYANGDSYEGEFIYLIQHGKGVYTFQNGTQEDREYDDGELKEPTLINS
eukprot:403361268